MITAAVTAAITAILALFGVTLSASRVLMIAVVAKVVIVAVGVLITLRLTKKRRAAANQGDSPAP